MIYSYLDHLIGAYLNQDYDLYGDTICEVVHCYIYSEGPEMSSGLAADCDKFLKEADIERKFIEQYAADFAPSLWGITAKEFLIYTKQWAHD